MPSPRREELDEGTLARDVALEVLLGQFDGRRLGAAEQGEKSQNARHLCDTSDTLW